MPDPEKKDELAMTKEDEQRMAHEKAVNEDPGEKPLPVSEADETKEAEKEDETKEKEVAEGKVELDADILAMVADVGKDEAWARSFSSDKDLTQALLALYEREEPVAKQEPEKEEPDKKPEPIHLQAGDDLDEALVKQVNEALDKISGRHDETANALREEIAALTATVQQSQAAQFVGQFDAMLSKHGEPYVHELGEGATMDQSSKHQKNREKIVKRMAVLVNAHIGANQPVPSDDRLVQDALKDVYGGRDKDNGEVKERQGQFLRRGSSRSSTAPSKQMRARTELREKLAALSGGGDE